MKVPSRKPDSEQCVRALKYAALGYFVFPLQAGTKSKQVPGAWPESSRDAERIRGWWRTDPDANIGIACKPSGIVVVDPDAPKQRADGGWTPDGRAEWRRIATEHGWPLEPHVTTPHGGHHLYFRIGDLAASNQTSWMPGVDVRAGGGDHGGYVVAPGSMVDGHAYRGTLPPVRDLTVVPASLAAALGSKATGDAAEARPAGAGSGGGMSLAQALLSPPLEGGRNDWLAMVAGHLAAKFHDDHATYQVLVEQANQRLADPLERDEARTTRESIWQAEQAKRSDLGRVAATGELDPALVAAEVQRELVRREAKRAVRRLTEPPVVNTPVLSLAAVLALPPEPPMRVAGLIPADALTLIVGQAKAGKTTFALNLAKSLLTGRAFLGAFPVVPVTGCVTMLNFEVSNRTLARWADEAGIDHDRFRLVALRGVGNPLDDPEARTQLAVALRAANTETLIVDPFSQAFSGDENSTAEVGAFLRDLVRWAYEEAGVRDLVLVAHAGHNGERVRGNSRLLGDPDAIITLTYDEQGEDRFMKAMGRDVSVHEDRLEFDQATRTLTRTGDGGRRDVEQRRKTDERAGRADSLLLAVRQTVDRQGRIKMGDLTKALREFEPKVTFRKGDEQQAVDEAQRRGWLVTEYPGPGHPRWVLSTRQTPSLLPDAPHPPRPSPALPAAPTGETPRTTLPGPPLGGGPGDGWVPAQGGDH